MNSVLVRLIIVKNNKEYNVLFDKSFSIKENIKLLNSLIDDQIDECSVYDSKLKIFIDKNASLDSYNIPSSRTFYIY